MQPIALTYSITELSQHGYKLSMRTQYTDSKDLDSAVFAIQVLPYVQQNNKQPEVRFSHVCDLAQMQQFGTEYDRQQPYFRTNEVQLIVHSRSQVQHVLKHIQLRIKQLMRQYQALQKQPETSATVLITP